MEGGPVSWMTTPAEEAIRRDARAGCGALLVVLVVVPLAIGLCAYAVRLGWILAAG